MADHVLLPAVIGTLCELIYRGYEINTEQMSYQDLMYVVRYIVTKPYPVTAMIMDKM